MCSDEYPSGVQVLFNFSGQLNPAGGEGREGSNVRREGMVASSDISGSTVLGDVNGRLDTAARAGRGLTSREQDVRKKNTEPHPHPGAALRLTWLDVRGTAVQRRNRNSAEVGKLGHYQGQSRQSFAQSDSV